MADLAEQVRSMVEPEIVRLGYEVVRVSLMGGQRAILQIMAERPDGVCLIEDCERISRAVSDLMDPNDPIPFAYRLEVSSPGIDRPLTRPKDFQTWAGHVAKVSLKAPLEGRKRFTGTLKGLIDDRVALDTEAGAFELPLTDIEGAKLVLTDDLIKATAPLRAAQGVV
jgi:ribosome maturation factor RimP